MLAAADCVPIDADTGAASARARARVEVCAVAAKSVYGGICVQALVGDDGSAVEVVFEAQAIGPAACRERQRPAAILAQNGSIDLRPAPSDKPPLLLAQPRMPMSPEGVLILTSPLFWAPVANRNVPRTASMAAVPLPLFGS